MKRFCSILLILSCIFLSGCGFWMDGERLSVEPYAPAGSSDSKKMVKVSNYTQMRNAILDMVENGMASGLLDVSEFNGSVQMELNTAVRYVQNTEPIGAYAVDFIHYEVGTYSGSEAVSIEIGYRFDREHILQIRQTEGMVRAYEEVGEALESLDASIVLYITGYEEKDFSQWVRDLTAERAGTVMEAPAVTASVFPEKGSNRILELTFTYQNSRETLQQMQQQVAPVFTSAELYVRNASQTREKYEQLYVFLMERADYTVETSITPAYSLLIHAVGDCRAFANVYRAMCRASGLDCYAITGTRDGEPWTWNVINYQGRYYHLDLLRSVEYGDFTPQTASEMSGYVWDYSASLK